MCNTQVAVLGLKTQLGVTLEVRHQRYVSWNGLSRCVYSQKQSLTAYYSMCFYGLGYVEVKDAVRHTQHLEGMQTPRNSSISTPYIKKTHCYSNMNSFYQSYVTDCNFEAMILLSKLRFNSFIFDNYCMQIYVSVSVNYSACLIADLHFSELIGYSKTWCMRLKLSFQLRPNYFTINSGYALPFLIKYRLSISSFLRIWSLLTWSIVGYDRCPFKSYL
jgi:hypothetical protein